MDYKLYHETILTKIRRFGHLSLIYYQNLNNFAFPQIILEYENYYDNVYPLPNIFVQFIKNMLIRCFSFDLAINFIHINSQFYLKQLASGFLHQRTFTLCLYSMAFKIDGTVSTNF